MFSIDVNRRQQNSDAFETFFSENARPKLQVLRYYLHARCKHVKGEIIF